MCVCVCVFERVRGGEKDKGEERRIVKGGS